MNIKLQENSSSYLCRQPFAEHHEKYFKLCKACGEINYKKKTELKDSKKII